MTDIFREVDEEIRQDHMKALWDKYGFYFVGACIGIVIAVGGIKGWQAYQRSVAEDAGAKYLAAVDLAVAGKQDDAQKEFDQLASGGPVGYSTLSRFQMAATLAASGNKPAAVTEYVKLANDTKIDDLLRGLANIRAGIILVDTGSRKDVEARVSKLNTRDNPWRNSARELLGLAAYRAGDAASADTLFNEIVGDPAAPSNIRQRAQVMLSLLAPERRPKTGGKTDSNTTTTQ